MITHDPKPHRRSTGRCRPRTKKNRLLLRQASVFRPCFSIFGMPADCGHLLCEIIGDSCSLATGRSRGCRPGLTSKTVATDVFDEVRGLLALIESDVRDERARAAAVLLAKIIRQEALEDRNLIAQAR